MDFEAHRREEVLNYIYDSYGRDRAAITCVTQVYHAATAVQDTMRALGYPAEVMRPISKRLGRLGPAEGAEMVEKDLAPRFSVALDARGRALLEAMRGLEELPRLRSTHPGGFVLSAEPLGEYMPIERTTRGRTILQFDKDDLDAVGVPKFDFLGLGALTAIRIAFDQIERRSGQRLDLYALPQDDPETFDHDLRRRHARHLPDREPGADPLHPANAPERIYDWWCRSRSSARARSRRSS